MMDPTETRLPPGWEGARIEQIAEVNPRLDLDDQTDGTTVSFVPMAAVKAETGSIDVSRNRPLSEVQKGYRHFRAGDVLFAKITPCMENGKMAVVPPLRYGLGFGSTEFHVLRPHREISPNYLYYYVSAAQFRRDAERHMTGAVGQRRVPTSYLAEQQIPLPPAQEQVRIATKIEELFSELDAGIESLQKARAQLATYRQSVLKHAYEGKLTAQWREENKNTEATSEQLLDRIRTQRAVRYEKQLRDWQIAKDMSDERAKTVRRRSKLKHPPDLGIADRVSNSRVPSLPYGWRWMRLGDIAEVSGGITKNQKRNALSRKMDEANSVVLKNGDLLVVEGNGSVEQVGRVAMWQGQVEDCGHQNHLIRVRMATEHDPHFVLRFLLSPLGRSLIMKEASSTSGLHTLSISKVESLPVPVASIAEEKMVVHQIDHELSITDALVDRIEGQLASASVLRKSVLNVAFAGRLVPTVSTDEPASVLLNRIRAERDQLSSRSRIKRTGTLTKRRVAT